MKKKLIIITTVVIMLLSVVSSLPVSAYVAPASLYFDYYSRSFAYTAPSNGILLIHSFYKCNISPSAPGLSLLDMLDKSYLTKYSSSVPIIWQGVQYDSDINLSDVSDVVGFSQTYSYSSVNSNFVYSIITCIPVVEGDKFTYFLKANSDFVSQTAQFGVSFVPYGTGLSKLYEAFHTGSSESNEYTYTTKSDNQHLACVLDPSKSFNGFNYSSPMVSSAVSSNISFVKSNYFCDIYTTTYGLSKNSNLTISSDSVDFSYSVYEIFMDGTYTPGIGDSGGGSGSGSGGTVGDITVNVDMSETNGKLDTLIAAVKALPSEIWDCFKVGLGISSDSSSGGSSSGGTSGGSSSFIPPSDLDVEIDSENVSNTLKGTTDSFLDSFASMRGAFHFFWKFVDNFFTSVSLYGVVGLSLIFALAYWLLNR